MSFILFQNAENSIYPNVSNLVTIENPYFLFLITDMTSKIKSTFTTANISSALTRYDEFKITLTGGTEDLYNGIINLPTQGKYKYEIYQTSASTININEIIGEKLENGIIKVIGNAMNELTSYSANTTYNYYQP
jgi:hypothetical protein